MGKLFAVFKREYLERVRSKWFLFGTLFGPVMMVALLVLPAYLASKSKASDDVSRIVILDASGAGLGGRISTALTTGAIAPEVRLTAPAELVAAESTATREVMSKKAQGYLIVDGLTMAGERARYAGQNASTIPDMERVQSAIRQSVLTMRLESAGLDPAKVQALSSVKLKLDSERLTEKGRGGGGKGNVILAYIVAVLLYMSIVLYGQAILMGVIEEKTQRVAEVVVASVSPDKLLAGKVLGLGAVGLTQQTAWIVSGFLLMRFQQPIMKAVGLPAVSAFQMPSVSLGLALSFLAFFVLGFVFFASLFAAAGSMVSSTQDAQQVSTPLMMLIVPSMILIGPVLLSPAGSLSRAVSLIPFTAPILMPVRMSITSVPLIEVLGSMAMLALACAGSIWVAARIYRVGVLMYGKKPSIRELIRWIRVAR